MKIYSENNKDKISSKQKAWREDNKDKRKAYNEAYNSGTDYKSNSLSWV